LDGYRKSSDVYSRSIFVRVRLVCSGGVSWCD
jgi:hypothetical protein